MNSKSSKTIKSNLNSSNRKSSISTISGTNKSKSKVIATSSFIKPNVPLKPTRPSKMDSNDLDLYPYSSMADSFQLDEALHWNQSQFAVQFHLLAKRLPIESLDVQLQTLHSLRRLLRANPYAGRLNVLERDSLAIFECLNQLLEIDRINRSDASAALVECVSLLVDLLVGAADMNCIDRAECMPRVLSRLVPQLGHPVTGVRRACLRLLHTYMRHTARLNAFIDTYITFGLKSKRSNEQKGCILSLPLLFTHEFVQSQEGIELFLQTSNEPLNLFPLLQCLSELLVHADARLFYAIYLAIQRLHTLLGNNVFRVYLQRVNQEAAILYDKVLSRNGSGAASLTNEAPDDNNDSADRSTSYKANRGGSSNETNDVEQSAETRPGDVTRTASRMEPPEPDKYEQMVLDQLASAEEEEVRKQSFELLSSPSSLLNPEDEFASAAVADESHRDLKQQQKEQLQHLQQQQLQQQQQEQQQQSQFRANEHSDQREMSSSEANIGTKLGPVTFGRVYASDMMANDHLRRAEWETRQVLQQLDGGSKFERSSTIRSNGAQETNHLDSDQTATVGESLVGQLGYTSEPHLMFGLFPNRMIERCLSTQLAVKNEAINQLLSIVKQAPCTQLTLFSAPQNLPPFFYQILLRLLEHPNFKVTLQALEIVQTLIIRLKHQLCSHLPLIINSIVRRLADSRVVVRQQAVHTFQLLTAKLPAQPLLEQLLVHVHARSGRLRAEVLNRVLALLLQVPRDQFNLCALCHRLPPLLLDSKRSVRLAALECAAVLAHCLGPNRQRRLLECVAVLAHVQKTDGLLPAVRARLARRDLPRLAADGQIRYALNPTGFAAWYPSASDADIEWVLQGSISAGSTPPTAIARATGLDSNNATISYTDANLCSMKRGSCALAGTEHELFEPNSYRYRQMLVDSVGPPPDTAAKASDCTVDIERLIEKNTIDQLKSRELSTGDSQYSMHSQPCPAMNGKNFGYEMLQLSHQLEDENDRTYDFEALQHHFQTSLNKPDDSEDREYGFCSMNSKRYESTIDVNKIDSEPAPSSSLRHSRTLSMPAIASSQLSDISERSEFVAPGQTRQYTIDGSCDQATTSDGQESGRKTVNENKVDEMNEVESKSDGQAQRKTSISSPQGKVTSETDEKDERRDGSESEMIGESSIEIKVQRASTTSEDSKPAIVPDYNQLGSDLYSRKKSTISMAKSTIKNPDQSDNGKRRTSMSKAKEESSGDNSEIVDLQSKQQTDFNANQAKKSETNASPTNRDEDLQMYIDSNGLVKRKASKSMIPTAVHNGPGQSTGTNDRTTEMDTGLVPPTPPSHHHHHHQHQLVRIQPAIPSNANIRNILENVTKTEGPFKEPDEAIKAAIAAFTQDAWTTKVEGMLAVNRLALFHPNVLKKELHTIVLALAYEVKNLRSTVARSAIFTLADLLQKMKGHIDPEMDIIAQALLHKCGENIQFIREDIEKSLENFIHYMPPVRAALCIIQHGTNHRSILVRRIAAHYLAELIESMGATKALLGPRDLAESLLPSVAALLLDRDPQARYSARRIFNVLMSHAQFNSLLGKHVQPAVYRTIIGSLQSIRRRGVGDRPSDVSTTIQSK